MEEIRECIWCWSEYLPKTETQKYCSCKCKTEKYCNDTKREKVINTCKYCGSKFFGRSGQLFCGKNCGRSYIRHGCAKEFAEINIKYNNTNDKDFAGKLYIESHTDDFEYVSGYTGSDGSAIIKCKKCGYEFKHCMVSLRDYSITLKKLFNRDNGICHICGGKCDYDDGYQTDVAFIAGNNYPSIDHVVAIANGGQHTWENVKLAHRICNTLKNDDIYFDTNGQMKFM